MKLQIIVTKLPPKGDGPELWHALSGQHEHTGSDRGKVIDEVKRIVYGQFATWEKPPAYVQFEVIDE